MLIDMSGVAKPLIRVSARINRRGRVVIEVADNGPGISGDMITKVFVPFYTTKREGSGVGLALTRQVMIAHGGSVVVGETDGGGATFALTF
jgi:two-component system, NtrC family, nitrogen regulation sensor histidine kinase NtrY